MDRDTQIWNEYQSLREEIRGTDSLNYQILAIVVGVSAIILAMGFTQADPLVRFFIFLCVYLITIPGYRLLQTNRRRAWRISTYIHIFLERRLEFVNWEMRLDALQAPGELESGRQPFSSLPSTEEWLILSALNSFAFFAAIFMGLRQSELPFTTQVIITVIGCVWWLGHLLRTSRQEEELRRHGKVEEDYLRAWTKMKKGRRSLAEPEKLPSP